MSNWWQEKVTGRGNKKKETFENQEKKEKEGIDQDGSEGKMKLYRSKERNVKM